MRYYAIIFFMAMSLGHFGFTVETLPVTKVEKGIVTMGKYEIPEDEAWKVGDVAEAIIHEGKIWEVRMK